MESRIILNNSTVLRVNKWEYDCIGAAFIVAEGVDGESYSVPVSSVLYIINGVSAPRDAVKITSERPETYRK